MSGIESLKAYRESHNMSLSALAREIGVSVPTVCRWESGKRLPSWSLLRRIQKITGIAAINLRPDLAEMMSEAAE